MNSERHMLHSKYLLALLSLMIFTSCGLFDKGSKNTERSGVEDFDRFYDKFHTNEKFQLSRLHFPLEGTKLEGGSEESWTKENWQMMKVKIQDIDDVGVETEFKRTGNQFYQKFWAPNTGFFAEYRFEVIKGKWYLVYAKDVNL